MADDQTSFTIMRSMTAPPMAIFRAWTEEFDTWFASPGSIRMVAVEGEPFWFEVVHGGARHPHYGRFLRLVPGRLVEQTWVTGQDGTRGAETVVRLELKEATQGTALRLTHSGFVDADSASRHLSSWPQILRHLDEVLTATS